jgi:hypothetical protein
MKRLARIATLVSVVAVFGLPGAALAQPPSAACEGLTTAHAAIPADVPGVAHEAVPMC